MPNQRKSSLSCPRKAALGNIFISVVQGNSKKRNKEKKKEEEIRDITDYFGALVASTLLILNFPHLYISYL